LWRVEASGKRQPPILSLGEKMRTQLLAATALTTTVGFLVPGVALAQPAFDWAGFYAGLSGGVINSQDTIDFSYSGSAVTLPSSVKIPAIGELGSVTMGYDWQNGQFVYGLAGDMSLLKLSASASGTDYDATASLSTLLSLRARFGVAFDRMMIFATAGVTGGHAEFNTDVGKGSSGYFQDAHGSGTVLGAVVGLGAEYAINDHVSLTAGAKYYNLGSLSAPGDTGKGSGVADPYTASYHPSGMIFETGLNVRF